MKQRAKPLRFTPLAWLKWQFLCHAGPTEVAGFGLSAADDLLFVEDVLVVRQRATSVTVAFDDDAVADLFDTMVDAGVQPEQFARIWLHTHPGAWVEPSHTDESTFRRVFGPCDWAVMAILGRTGRTSSRLRFSAGPGGHLAQSVVVDWQRWPNEAEHFATQLGEWQREYDTLVEVAPLISFDTMVFDDLYTEDPTLLQACFDPLSQGEPHEVE